MNAAQSTEELTAPNKPSLFDFEGQYYDDAPALRGVPAPGGFTSLIRRLRSIGNAVDFTYMPYLGGFP